MTSRSRYFVSLSTKEYATLYGLSERSVRRRAESLGARKGARGKWHIPVAATEYARKTGKSVKSVRKTAITLPQFQATNQGTLKAQAERQLATLLANAPTQKRVNPNTVHKRIQHASPSQARRVINLTPAQIAQLIQGDMFNDDWMGDDDLSILLYR